LTTDSSGTSVRRLASTSWIRGLTCAFRSMCKISEINENVLRNQVIASDMMCKPPSSSSNYQLYIFSIWYVLWRWLFCNL